MKNIIVKDEYDNKYTLCFTAETVKTLERKGFTLEKLADQPVNMIPIFFEGAFLAECRNKVTSEGAQKIYSAQKNKQGLLEKLIELYNEPIDELLANEGNSDWEANF